MQHRILHEESGGDGLRTIAVVFDKHDEAVTGLEEVARELDLTGAAVSAIGAFRECTLAYFDPNAKLYRKIPVPQQVEVVSMLGDIALDEDGEPTLHAHVVVGKPDGTTAGGHLQSATVWPTLEVVLTETPAHLQKRMDEETGLALIDLSEG